MEKRKLVRLGLLGAILTCIAELCFHYVPFSQAQTLLIDQRFLELISQERLVLGYVILLIGAPLYYLGYLGVFSLVSSYTKKPAYLFLGTAYFMVTMGIIWLSARPVEVLLTQSTLNLPLFGAFQENIISLVRVLLCGLSVYMVWIFRETLFGQWLLLANPFTVWAILFLGFSISPALFWPFLIAAFNVAHIVFFAFILKTEKAYV